MGTLGTQLLLPDGLSAAAAAERLAGELPVATQRARTLRRTFWDTFDGRVHGAGLALVAVGRRLALADATTYAEQVAADDGTNARRLLAGDLEPGPLRDRLAALIDVRALMPVARVRSRMVAANVLDELGKTVVRLRLEEPVALADGARELALRPRLHVAGVRGYDADYERVLALLTERLGLVAAPRPLHDDAVEAAGGAIGGTSSKLRVRLRPEMRADAAAVAILRRLLDVVEVNLPGALADVDTEFLHDLRVAVRRTRSLQRELRRVFPPEPLRVFRNGFRELQAITGPVRDLDVQLLDFDDLAGGPASAQDVEPLRRLLQSHLAIERRAMAHALRSAATAALLDNWRAFLDGLVEADEVDRPDAARPVADVAAARIARVYRRMVKAGTAIDDASPAEALHELRKQGKELRYLLEFFAPLFPAAVVKPMVATLKDLQDVLGRFQDREVQAALLRELGDEVATQEGAAGALMAMGVLVERLGEQQARARAEFAASFARFADKRQRTLVARTFAP